ncbi:MAG TPA: uracil-DNA glycosylase [Acidimicrobiales bacterium]|jgi:uracil-DNA glycosylase|nr:uracil-DNA glycosylase [Acidimicrobiales bacterium]
MAGTGADDLARLAADVVSCETCPRLVAWRRQVAVDKRAAYARDHYWGAPVPGFGDPRARLLIVGLAPAAHGANRTGRMFTGDRSGDWLFRALHRAGFASQPTSEHRGDGLALRDAYLTAAVRCAPPANRPTPAERDACRPYLTRELTLLDGVAVIVALGAFAYQAVAAAVGLRPRPRFGHGVEAEAPGGAVVICSYHPSQQNTFTGRLTEAMLDRVFSRARRLIGDEAPG